MSEEVDKEVEHTEISSLKTEIEKLKLNNDMKEKEFDKLKNDFVNAMQLNATEMQQIRELTKVLKSSNKEN